MAKERQNGKLSAGERLTATTLRWGPLLAYLACALPPPVYFLYLYFTSAEEAGVYMLFALTSLAVGSVVGLVAAFLVFFYRRLWERRLRERLAADGVTADELSWFMSELTPAQRRTLKEMEGKNPLLADAYRETLAARVTAARVTANARRESASVERRLRSASGLRAAGRAELERGLQEDRERLARVSREADEHRAEIETRLQIIEALAGRNASHAETEVALQRLGSVREHVPLGLSSAQAEREVREQVERELRELPPPQSREMQ